MTLSSDLLSQFAKLTTKKEETKKETTVYGTVVDSGHVRLDGSTVDTPIASTTMVKAGERVMVLIKDHTATVTGNLSDKSASSETVKKINDDLQSLDIETLNAKLATIDTLEADNVTIKDTLTVNGQLVTSVLDAETAKITYANIDFSNVGEAAVEKLFAASGIIENLTMSNGTVTGKLTSVTVHGDLIEGGTIVANKLIVQGEDGLYYKLNTDGIKVEAEQTEYNSLNGNVIMAQSITASKIDVDDLNAFKATIGGFKIGQSSIYSGVKESIANTTQGIYLDSTGQMNLGDASYFVKYYKDGSAYKLAIAAESLSFGINKTDVATAVSDAGKTATDFLSVSDAGLVVGDLTGDTLGNNVLIDSDSVDIRNGDQVRASFGSDYLYLAKHSRNAKIDLCNGLVTLYHESKYSYDSLFVIDSGTTEILGVINPLCVTSTNTLQEVSIQFANKNGVMGGIGMTGNVGQDGWLRRYGKNMFDKYTVLDSGNYFDVMDDGWHYTGGYGANFTQYGNSLDSKVRYRKMAGRVEIKGAMSPTKIFTSSTEQLELFTLPEGYRPDSRVVQRCQGSGLNTWLLIIDSNGVATFSRYGNGTSYGEVNSDTWLPFQVSFFVD